MGYYSRVTGEIGIYPPLMYAEMQAEGPLREYVGDNASRNGVSVKIPVAINEVETPEGVLHRQSGNIITAAYGDSYKAYNLVEDVKKIVKLIGDSHVLNGQLRVEGEENGDIWRVLVKDNVVIEELAKVVWPNGETEDLTRG